MKNNYFHVVPNPKGGWDVKREGGERSSGHFNTKKEAIDFARRLSKNENGELFIHLKNGNFSDRDSHGNDLFPPKG